MKAWEYLLLPFSYLYGGIVRVRNWMFDKGIKESKQFDIPVICIGNLSAGGTGKTPMSEYVIKLLLSHGYRPALLSRGYGRKTKGFQLVKPFSRASEVGDEPYQVKRKFPDTIVAVCEERVEGINRIKELFPSVNVIVLDDAFQHRAVKAGFTILLTDFNKPYFADAMLPAGRLREPRSGKERADVIIMTKCPDGLGETQKEALRKKLAPSPQQQTYFTCIGYRQIVKVQIEEQLEIAYDAAYLKGYHIILFTGIANPKPMEDYLRKQEIAYELVAFPDHHIFTKADINRMLQCWNDVKPLNKLLLTTEKDWRRLENTEEAQMLCDKLMYFLPIEVEWNSAEKSSFDAKILQYVSADTGSN
jgi:tetraacyldisaccharide 4'-kinase